MRIERIEWDGAGSAALATRLRSPSAEHAEAVGEQAAAAIARVRDGGDAAVIELTERFDGVRVDSLRVTTDALDEALEQLRPELRDALERSAANIRRVAEAQVASEVVVKPGDGQRVTVAEVPVAAAGIYAPGGRSPYPSSVLMGVIPALAAGVERVAVASPPGANGRPAAPVLGAARIAGASEVYAMGGAQAVAALAFGTESVAAVDVIAGPGSPWVQEAKLACARWVGIDGYAGPSELMVICDRATTARWVALDLLAQGEHGDDGLLLAVSVDEGLLDELAAELPQLAAERPSVIADSIALVSVPDSEAALALAEALAPEHLELACADAGDRAGLVRTAGCVFVGPFAGAAFGDYSAGSNHVLPTAGSGRFSGPLGPSTFRRRISRVEIDRAAAAALTPSVEAIAGSEGFPVHAESTSARSTGPAERSS